MNPIAAYTFSRGFSTRTFLLFIDRVTIKEVFRFADCIQETQPFALRCLNSVPVGGQSRSPGFTVGICACLGGFALAVTWLLSRGLELPGHPQAFPLAMTAIGLAGLVCALRSTRHWQYARFYSEVGGLVFTLQCPPSDTIVFEEFVKAVTKQIQSFDHAG